MSTKEEVMQLVYVALKELGAEINRPELAAPTPDLRLLGASSPLDSMALVSLIADLENRVAESFGVDVVIADERAMSAMRSPFRSVEILTEHITVLVSAGKNK